MTIHKIRAAFNDSNRYAEGAGTEHQELVKKVRAAWYEIQSSGEAPLIRTEIYKAIRSAIKPNQI